MCKESWKLRLSTKLSTIWQIIDYLSKKIDYRLIVDIIDTPGHPVTEIQGKMQYMESPKWEGGKAPNERRGKPKWEEGRRIQSEKRKTNGWPKTKEIQLKNAENGMPKWEEGKAQMRGGEKSSCTAAPSGLMLGSSLKKCEFTCWRYQLCAPFSTFNENFCHKLPWQFNSLVISTSFSQLTTQWVGEPD